MGTAYDILIHQRRLETHKFADNIVNKVNRTATLNTIIIDTDRSTNIKCPSVLGEVLLCWSVYTNTISIFNTKLGNDEIPIIHGLRFFGMTWIILIHSILYTSEYIENRTWAWRLTEGLINQIFSNGAVSVDTFFTISGFLAAWVFLKNQHKQIVKTQIIRWFYYFKLLLKRFIRLTPAYIIILGIIQMLSTWTHETSIFYKNERLDKLCAQYWWRNLLYINNFFDTHTTMVSLLKINLIFTIVIVCL